MYRINDTFEYYGNRRHLHGRLVMITRKYAGGEFRVEFIGLGKQGFDLDEKYASKVLTKPRGSKLCVSIG